VLTELLLLPLEQPLLHEDARALGSALLRLALDFPAARVHLTTRRAHVPADAWVVVSEWNAKDFDLRRFDARLNALGGRGPFALGIAGEAARLPRATAEILTRCQRLCPRRNEASRAAPFDRILERHRALHDLSKPLVRADYDHALDTWQWLLRLAPGAGLGLQIAALFHDIERLTSEADARVEHRAADYQAFKDAHARTGAEIARGALLSADLPAPELELAARLIAAHERPRGDPDLDLLNDADALSFFSLNSGGFMDYYGPDHTRRKVDYTLARLRPEGRVQLSGVRLRDDIATLVVSALEQPAGAS
jgi:Domain of unknown function (DUF4202)